MEITKELVLKWMHKNNHSKAWLAKQCFVTERTISNWLTTKNRNLPKTQLPTLSRLIESDSKKSQNLLITGLSIDEFKQMEIQANEEGIVHVHDWAQKTLIEKSKPKNQ